ncbi:class 3 adenylate cyclase [Archangium gephyra]|uniref:Adenylate cyclase n=1 Tax=Archangium gephyra TaxID=48 RepID=A0AAC8TBI8_9BACT|nr:adenylate/guanylate cyclase domain-containing protein [Archangium gephyra]AKI99909.1 Adenylate cyclase [Archangium gephyra]REG33378.1 class 3 adenylate cyclase [Archangium gephyra]
MRLPRISSWPVALKLSLAFLAAALLPMELTAAYNLHKSLESVRHSTLLNLALFAGTTAARLDQLVTDTGRTVAQISTDMEVESFLSNPQPDSVARASVQRTLQNVVGSNPDIFSVFLLDKAGTCLASTNRDNVGQDYSFRSYHREALAHGSHVSELLTGSTTKEPGIFFSRTVHDGTGALLGVVVLKLRGESLADMVGALRPGEDGHGFVVDEYGVIIGHTNRDLRFRSLTSLSPEVLKLPVFDRRFSSVGIETIQALGWDELGRTMIRAAEPGHTRYTDAQGEGHIVGFAPMKTRPWTVGFELPEAQFSLPLFSLMRSALVSVLLVSLGVSLLSLRLVRGLVRPVLDLTRAARAVQRGDFASPRVAVRTEDELGVLASSFNTMVAGLAERERERDIFGRVVSPEVREKLLGGELRLGGETRNVAVLFSDIRGFSSLSERMDPQGVVALLNEYLTEMAEAVRPYQGYINNFIGDAIVVIFGAPLVQPDIERRAVRAALAMQTRLAALNARRRARGDFPIETGIGICAGEVVAGQIGSPERLLYTVIGDTVNVAARLEALTRDYPQHSILVNPAVVRAVRDEPGLRIESLGPIRLKGRAEPVDVSALHAEDSGTGTPPERLSG